MNINWSQKILRSLHAEGVREVIVCAGARNSPLVASLARTRGLEIHSFFEERSASFFAVGVARRTGRPVAVLTTSGTAAAELLPAVVEAFHTGVPLILVTADRPRRLRGSGAPQAIDQAGLFGKFVSMEFDLEMDEAEISLESWNRRSPVHLNICFDEPLIDVKPEDLTLASSVENERALKPFNGASTFSVSAGPEWAGLRLVKFLRTPGPLLVLVGTLETQGERDAVAGFLSRLRAPTYLESTSGLRERRELRDFSIRSGDKFLSWALSRDLFSRVLRIGGVPTARIWRDLDERDSSIDVLSVTSLPFAGLSRGEMVCCDIALALDSVQVSPETSAQASLTAIPVFTKDRQAEAELMQLFDEEPLAEPSMMRALSTLMAGDALVYVGNSLPIREWDLAAVSDHARAVEANRGVNGIDGQVSTFLGLAPQAREAWAILGDLTSLYDLAGPWALRVRPGLLSRIVVINNGGGKIFGRIFKDELFENRHDISFEGWAQLWRLPYQKWVSVPSELAQASSPCEIIEVIPDPEATTRFWDRYDQIWTRG